MNGDTEGGARPINYGMFIMPYHPSGKPLAQCFDEDVIVWQKRHSGNSGYGSGVASASGSSERVTLPTVSLTSRS